MGLGEWQFRAVAAQPSEVVAWAPASQADRPTWFLVSGDVLRGIDLVSGAMFFEARLPFAIDRSPEAQRPPVIIRASPSGRYVAVAQRRGLEGAVFDVETGAQTLPLRRGDYHPEHCTFPLAFLDDRRLLHGIEWNALAVTALPSGERLSRDGKTRLDYFYSDLQLSPDRRWVASAGWVWHPVAMVGTFELEPWLTGAVPEPDLKSSVDGDVWDLPVCWLDDEEFAAFVIAEDGASALVRARHGGEPEQRVELEVADELVLRRDLVVCLCGGPNRKTTVLSRSHLGRQWLGALDSLGWHPGTQEALVVHDGRLSLASWPRPIQDVPESLRGLARTLRGDARLEARLVLADALEQAGITGADLDHLRSPEPHDHHRCFVAEDLQFE